MKSFAGPFLRVFNICENQPARYYGDLFASVVCILSLLVATAALLSHKGGWTILIAVGTFLFGLVIASRKSIPLASAFLFLGLRFAFAFLISFRLSALGGALFCLSITTWIVRLSESRLR